MAAPMPVDISRIRSTILSCKSSFKARTVPSNSTVFGIIFWLKPPVTRVIESTAGSTARILRDLID